MNEDLLNEKDENVKPLKSEKKEETEEAKETKAEVVEEETTEEKTTEEKTTEEKVEDYKEKFLYLAAEMENMKKRHAREREDLLKYGNEKVLRDLIEVVDNLERSIDAVKNDEDEKVKNIIVGLDMVLNLFVKTLEGHGLKVVEAEGLKFDPHVHEALSQQAVEGVEENTVVSVFQKGYTLNGRLIRAAKVVVAK